MEFYEFKILSQVGLKDVMKNKIYTLPVLFVIVSLFQMNPALARSDNLIKSEIEVNFAATSELKNIPINVYVNQRLVVLSGKVRLLEQKLIAERIAWTTIGVSEVDNEIQVVPKIPLADAGIEKKIKMIIKSDPQFVAAELVVQVVKGEVYLSGSFLNLRDPSRLKHKVAEIEGVVDIKINVSFVS